MKMQKMTCPACGGTLKLNEWQEFIDCPFCGSQIYLDNEKIHVVYDDMENAGYEFERGRIRAQRENSWSSTDESQEDIRPRTVEDWEKEQEIRKKIRQQTPENIKSGGIGCLVFVIGFFVFFWLLFKGFAWLDEWAQLPAKDEQQIADEINVDDSEVSLDKEDTQEENDKIGIKTGSPELISKEEYEASKPKPREPIATAIQEKKEREEKAHKEWIDKEKRMWNANKVNYILDKYNKIASYPIGMPSGVYSYVTAGGGERNYYYGVAIEKYALKIWITWISYNINETHERLRPVLRDFIWTCDSKLSDIEVNDIIDELMKGEHDDSNPLYAAKGKSTLSIFKNKNLGTSTLRFEMELYGMPTLPEKESWYDEHKGEKDPNYDSIAQLLYETPSGKRYVKPAPLDPAKDFDVFMDIYGEEFSNEDDAWDAWQEGYYLDG